MSEAREKGIIRQQTLCRRVESHDMINVQLLEDLTEKTRIICM